ncbi:MAG: ROK family protein [Gaiellaceae bacterium MAG52_C11]|nr:ROK family protein [Candidatus Gaiellasilicea maunaloa]
MSSQRVIGVDLGGTKILAGVLDRDGSILEAREVPTPTESQAELVEGIAGAVEKLLGPGIAALGLGIPSVLAADGRSLDSNNIPLAGIALAEVLGERLGLPAAVENDANAAALAEWRLGAGREVAALVMLTLGTGVGGGVVLESGLYRGWAELGHVVVVADGPPCQGNCTGRGHLEAVASGNAADRAAEALWGAGSTAEQLVDRARAGAGEAVEALALIGRRLGAAIGSFVNIFGVRLVVVGGGFGVAAADFLFEAALETARREALPPGRDLRIVAAELGSKAGLVGAGLVAFEALDGTR